MNTDLEFSFSQQIEPFYRQLVGLLLHDINSLDEQERQVRLEESRIAIENLQKEQLEYFYPLAWLEFNQQKINELDSDVAVIYPFVLDHSLEVIVFARGKPLEHYRTEVDIKIQKEIFEGFAQYLNPISQISEVLPFVQQLYKWLIFPAEIFFQENRITTLVFVLDSLLRNLPMSALHDGDKYLIEKYNIVNIWSLNSIFTIETKKTVFNHLTVAIMHAREGFPSLLGIEQEIDKISQPIATDILLDDKFTSQSLELQIKKNLYSTIHFATYAKLSSCVDNTFMMTWNERLTVNHLYKFRKRDKNQKHIDLLVFTACEIENKEKNALLGLLGIAIGFKAVSTIATLWLIREHSTMSLIQEFYRLLMKHNISKAEALRRAQINILQNPKYRHPYYWSSFILFGSWE